MVESSRDISLAQDEIPDYQHVDSGSVEDPHGVTRGADNWLLKSIERSVDENWSASRATERLEQCAQLWRLIPYRMNPESCARARHDAMKQSGVLYAMLELHEA